MESIAKALESAMKVNSKMINAQESARFFTLMGDIISECLIAIRKMAEVAYISVPMQLIHQLTILNQLHH